MHIAPLFKNCHRSIPLYLELGLVKAPDYEDKVIRVRLDIGLIRERLGKQRVRHYVPENWPAAGTLGATPFGFMLGPRCPCFKEHPAVPQVASYQSEDVQRTVSLTEMEQD
ncbi:hypothetical protein AVEN_233280-1 [Araneus ventricosus]|uniref:Uncharacterized protein n=1 Tax=Araneus ventricosus TaxID=182803 RepID=A0A4Y2SF08_ARAVE|nr:hypothetical protein AVEN_233280-1 [Araneus ventricosus]